MKRLFSMCALALSLVLALMLAPVLANDSRAGEGGSLGDVLGALPVIRGTAPGGDAFFQDHVVLVAFFASWCPPCKHEFPHLNTVQNAYGDQGFRIVAVNVFETFNGLSTPAKLDAFLDDVQPTFPVLKGDDATRRVFGNLDRIPTMFVFKRDGTPAYVFRHEPNAEKTHLSEEELRAVIEPLL